MSKLVAFGCSHTSGHGLPDHSGSCDTVSKFAWPQLLADRLGLKCDNRGKCAASATEILLEILNYPFDKDDLVVVMWTFVGRELLLREDSNNLQILPNDYKTAEPYSHFLKLHTPYDLNYRMWITMHHAFLHLTRLNVNFHFCTVVPMQPLLDIRPYWATPIELLDFNGNIYHSYPKALDNMHPGVECHAKFAFNLYHEIF